MLNQRDQKLYKAAVEARENSYSPYSHFAVGAAVRTAAGKIYKGCNIENGSYGLTVCAERIMQSLLLLAQGRVS